MTTQVIIDAHAGWDVEVKIEVLDQDKNVSRTETKVIPKNTKDTVYIHSHMQISSIKELPNT